MKKSDNAKEVLYHINFMLNCAVVNVSEYTDEEISTLISIMHSIIESHCAEKQKEEELSSEIQQFMGMSEFLKKVKKQDIIK